MKPYIDLLFLAVIVVFIVDISGFTDSWLDALSKWIGHRVTGVKPFSCSLCMTWWSGIVYALATRNFTLPVIAYVALMAFLSLPISEVLIFIREKILEWIRKNE